MISEVLINEKFELTKFFENNLLKQIALFDDFKDMWINDIQNIFHTGPTDKINQAANSILKYFNLDFYAEFHSYDDENQSIIWQIVK